MEILLALLAGGGATASLELVKFLLRRRQSAAETDLTAAQTDLTRVQALQTLVTTLSEQVTIALARVQTLTVQLDEANEKIKAHLPWDEHVAHRLAQHEPVPARPPL